MIRGQSIAWRTWVFWGLLLVVLLGVRIYLFNLLPACLWSKDAGSYLRSAYEWLQTGHWETDPRRGPVYSMFLAGCLYLWGDFNFVIIMQHMLGVAAVLMAVGVMSGMHPGARWWALWLCGYALAVNGGILHMGHMIRNETLLLFFATLALACWWAALRSIHPGWLLICGAATALLTLTKNIFAPFPLVVVGFAWWQHRAVWRRALLHVSFFLVGLGIPYCAAALVKPKTTEPQEGYLLYARVAQFTVLDGGIEPDIKAIIRSDIEAYRQQGKLDNNIILKRTAVPKINQHLRERGRSMAEANALCRRLAIEAIRANPGPYALQVIGDLRDLLLNNAKKIRKPDSGDIETNRSLLANKGSVPWVRLPQSLAAAEAAAVPGHFRVYHWITSSSWLFIVAPVLITTVLIPLFIWFSAGAERLWWLGLAALWGFTLSLLCTVGRPMDRYLLPVLPIMFWSLSHGLFLLWDSTVHFLRKRSTSANQRAGHVEA